MTKVAFFVFFLAVFVLSNTGCTKMRGDMPLKTDEQKLSYALGMQIGQGMKAQSIRVDGEYVGLAIADVMAGKKSRMTEQEMFLALQKMQKDAMSQRAEEAQKNKTAGDKFLAEKKKNPKVKSTASGLLYEVVKPGKGPSPKSTDTVKVHYRGS